MKKILGMFLAVALSLGSAFGAEALSKKGMAGNLEVEYSTLKPISQGMNLIKVKVMDGTKEVKDAKVSIIAAMPAMPGMHAMEEKADAVYKDGAYEANVIFAMNGTWQISIVIERADGKKQRLKSSVKSLMKRALFVVALFSGYAWAQSELTSLAYSHNYELKALEAEVNALEKEVDISKIWENPMLSLGVNDIFLNEPLKRNQEAQNEAISLSQKIPTGGKLDIKESIALQDLAIKKLELKAKKLEMQQEIGVLEQSYIRIHQDLAVVTKYEKILEDLKNAHLAYNTTAAHYVDTLNNTILQKNLAIEKKTLLRDKASIERKLESIIVAQMPEMSAKEGLLPYKLSDEEKLLEKSPKLQVQNMQSAKELLNLRYEKANKTPDVTVSLGYNRRQGRDDYAFLGVSVPLPIYGKENASIQKAALTHAASEQSVQSVHKKLLFELRDELLNKELQYDKISLAKEVLYENQKMYEVLQSTALSQNDALLSLLNVLTQMLEAQKQINANTFAYNESIIKIYTLLGEPL